MCLIYFNIRWLKKPNICTICVEPFRNGSLWRGFFEPSTAPFRYERERVLTNSTNIGFKRLIEDFINSPHLNV